MGGSGKKIEITPAGIQNPGSNDPRPHGIRKVVCKMDASHLHSSKAHMALEHSHSSTGPTQGPPRSIAMARNAR